MLKSHSKNSENAKLIIKDKFKNYVSGFRDLSSIDKEKHEKIY